MRKKNILIISPDIIDNSMGGLGVHLNNLLKHIDYSKFNICMMCLSSYNGIQEYKVNGTKNKCIILNIKSTVGISLHRSYVLDVLLLQTIMASEFIKWSQESKFKPDVIHFCDWTTYWAAFNIAKVFDSKLIYAVHLSISNYIEGYGAYYDNEYKEACQIESTAITNADAIIQVSEYYSNLFPFEYYKDKTFIAPNGVEYDKFKQSFCEGNSNLSLMGNTDNKFKIAYVGRLAAMKNPLLLLDVELPKNADLFFIGGEQGSDVKIINTIISKSKEENNIFYLGYVPQKHIPNIMSSADLIIMPSKHEPFGIVALEALAAGQNGKTLLAASFKGGLGDFLNEKAALNCGDSLNSIQAALDKFFLMTEQEKEEMRKEGCKIAKQYSWKNCADKIMEVWDKL